MVRRSVRAAAWLLLVAPAAATGQPTIKAIVETVDLSSLALSPDGMLLAFRVEAPSIARNTVDLSWYVVPTARGGEAVRIGDAGEGERYAGSLVSAVPRWSHDGKWLYYRQVADGQAQVWRASRDGRTQEQVTRDPGDVLAFAVLGTDAVVYSAGAPRAAIADAEQQEYEHGVRIDSTIDPVSPLFRGDRINGRWASERLVGFWFRRGGLLNAVPPHYAVATPDNGGSRPATAAERALVPSEVYPFDRLADRQILQRSPDPATSRSLYVVDDDGRHARLIVQDAAAASRRWCTDSACTGQQIMWANWVTGANRVLFQTRDDTGSKRLNTWDVTNGSARALKPTRETLDGGRAGDTGCVATVGTAFCVAASANAPPRLIAIALEDGRRRVVYDPNSQLLPPGDLLFEDLHWRSADGIAFTGELMRPRRSNRVPLFITYYTCEGFLRGGTGDEFPLRQLADRGIAALCINRADSSLSDYHQQAEYRKALGGVEAAVRLLDQRGVIDPRRVGMGGLSFGGEVAAWTLTHSNLLAAASLSSTLTTPTYYWLNAIAGRDFRKVLRDVWEVGDPDSDHAGWKKLSVAYNIDAIHAPVLMQMPEEEYRYNVEIAARLGAAGKAVDLWAFPDEKHIKMQPRHQVAVYERNLDWFCYWLLGTSDPSPSKQAQYNVWRSFAQKPILASSINLAQPSSRLWTQASTSASVRTR